MFDIQHYDNPSLETRPFAVWFRYYWQPSRPQPKGLDSVYTWGGSAPGWTQFDRVWWSSTERIGAVRFVFTLRGNSNCVDPES